MFSDGDECSDQLDSPLLEQVYSCCACEGEKLASRFTRKAPGEPYYKFPHRIGSRRKGIILFVGMNPRRNPSREFDIRIHDFVMASEAHFLKLSRNKIDGRDYMGALGVERHYDLHVAIANAAFPGKRFDEVAAVTELFLCATPNGTGLPFDSSPCANRYLDHTITEVEPSVIVAVGRLVWSYFQSTWTVRGRTFRRLPSAVEN